MSAITATGGGPPVVTMESAMHEVLAWHPSVVQATATIEARAEDIEVARAGYLPGSARASAAAMTTGGQCLAAPPAISASQMIYDFGKVAGAVESAARGTRIGRADLLLAVDGLIRDTGFALVEVQRNAALRTIAMEQLAVSARSARWSTTVWQGGDHPLRRASGAIARAAAEATLTRIEAEQRRWTTAAWPFCWAARRHRWSTRRCPTG